MRILFPWFGIHCKSLGHVTYKIVVISPVTFEMIVQSQSPVQNVLHVQSNGTHDQKGIIRSHLVHICSHGRQWLQNDYKWCIQETSTWIVRTGSPYYQESMLFQFWVKQSLLPPLYKPMCMHVIVTILPTEAVPLVCGWVWVSVLTRPIMCEQLNFHSWLFNIGIYHLMIKSCIFIGLA